MKIGTINFHRSYNYGALLVTYSLITYLKKIGIEAKPIDYFPEHHTVMYPHPNEAYDKFINKYLKPFYSKDDVFDLVIYGADTIWERYKEYGYDDTYWGSGKINAKRKITYSASGTMRNFTEESDELFRKNIDNFEFVSVREDVLKSYIEKITNKKIKHTCDPTLLLSEEEYQEIMSERIIEEEYALVYNRQLGSKLFEASQTVSEKTGLYTVILKGDGCLYECSGKIIRRDIGPSEFLSLVKHSSYVLAASFHAVAFSIIFKRQFNTIMKSGSERVDSILRLLELEHRKIDHTKEIDVDEMINYKDMSLLSEYIETSRNYLLKALQRNLETYVWGAAAWGEQVIDLYKNRFNVIGFIDKEREKKEKLHSLPVIAPEQYFTICKNRYHNIIVAVKYPGEVVQLLNRFENNINIFIYDGRDRSNPFLYKVKNNEICVSEYMDKRYIEWKDYSLPYKELSREIINLFNKVYEWVSREEKETSILEIGCGSGQLANLLFEKQRTNYLGIDFSKEAIELAKKTNKKYEEKFICRDFFTYAESNILNKSTIYIALEVLEHINRDLELVRKLPTGSVIIFSVPNFKSFNHVRTYNTIYEISERYPMIEILQYEKVYANQKQDKIYHLVMGKIKDL